METRALSCFCQVCLELEEGECANGVFVDNWVQRSVNKKQPRVKKSHPKSRKGTPQLLSVPPTVRSRSCVVRSRSIGVPSVKSSSSSGLEVRSIPPVVGSLSDLVRSSAAPSTRVPSSAKVTSSTRVLPVPSSAMVAPSTRVLPVPSSLRVERASSVLTPLSSLGRSDSVDALNLSLSQRDRIEVFDAHLTDLSSCLSFEELERHVFDISQSIVEYDLVSSAVTQLSSNCTTDVNAQKHLPPNILKRMVPVVIEGDGNCLVRSLCMAFSGDDSWHAELRVRLIIELVQRQDFYLNANSLKESGNSTLTSVKLFNNICFNTSPCAESVSSFVKVDNIFTAVDPQAIFKAEVLGTSKRGVFLGMWHLYAAANVLGCNIRSVHPALGDPTNQELYNSEIRPFSFCSSNTLHILWTSGRSDMKDEYWLPNHCVALLPSGSVCPVVRSIRLNQAIDMLYM